MDESLTPPARVTPTPDRDVRILLIMILAIVCPAGITLFSVRAPGQLIVTAPDPTPKGYTISLLIYLVPLLIIYGWQRRSLRMHAMHRFAFHWSVGLLLVFALVLDIVFGLTFFHFDNPDATLGVYLPGFSTATWSWVRSAIPVEEVLFYGLGLSLVLLTYIWNDEDWCSAYNRDDYLTQATVNSTPFLLRLRLRWVAGGAAMIAAAFVIKKVILQQPGWPAYLTFLVVLAVIPGTAFLNATKAFINWRAFLITVYYLLLTSLLWEATLGVPYAWWGYNDHYMTGIFIGVWHRLPVEAVIVWLVATLTVVVIYELAKVAYAVHHVTINAGLASDATPDLRGPGPRHFRKLLIGDQSARDWVRLTLRW